MKNLKLFTIPLLGAAFLVACGPKPMDVKDFRAKVEEKFNIDTIREGYVGKKQHMTGNDFTGPVDENHQIASVEPITKTGSDNNIYHFTFSDSFTATNYDVLSTGLIDYIIAEQQSGVDATVNYFISGDTYTIEAQTNIEGTKQSVKYIYNKDLVITYSEMKVSGTGLDMNIQLNFKYE